MATSKQSMGKKDTAKGTSAKTAGIGMATGLPLTTGTSGPVKKQQMTDEMRFKVEDDLRTLHRAHQIITDKPRHGAVKALAAQQTKAVMKFGKK